MEQLFTASNLINVIAVILAWSIKQELRHIADSIKDAKETANEAHKRIDDILITQKG